MRFLTYATGFLVVGALVCLPMGSAQALEGNGFTEQILSCASSSHVIIEAKKGQLVMIRNAPECNKRTPKVIKATSDKTYKFKTWGLGKTVKHTVEVWVHE